VKAFLLGSVSHAVVQHAARACWSFPPPPSSRGDTTARLLVHTGAGGTAQQPQKIDLFRPYTPRRAMIACPSSCITMPRAAQGTGESHGPGQLVRDRVSSAGLDSMRTSFRMTSQGSRTRGRTVVQRGEVRAADPDALAHLELEISHNTLDQGQATGYLRAALVTAGALEPRDETLTRFARWADAQVDELPEHPDRVHLAAYTSWRLHGDLARRTHTGAGKRNTHRKRNLRVAIMLTGWLHDQGRTLADLRQDLVEDWLADAPSRSLPLRDF
jgi:hypothetical protein